MSELHNPELFAPYEVSEQYCQRFDEAERLFHSALKQRGQHTRIIGNGNQLLWLSGDKISKAARMLQVRYVREYQAHIFNLESPQLVSYVLQKARSANDLGILTLRNIGLYRTVIDETAQPQQETVIDIHDFHHQSLEAVLDCLRYLEQYENGAPISETEFLEKTAAFSGRSAAEIEPQNL